MAGRNAAKELDDPDRAALIHEISDVSGVTDINLATWACVWFADISKLRGMLDDLKDNPAKSSTEAWLRSADAEMALNTCKFTDLRLALAVLTDFKRRWTGEKQ